MMQFQPVNPFIPIRVNTQPAINRLCFGNRDMFPGYLTPGGLAVAKPFAIFPYYFAIQIKFTA